MLFLAAALAAANLLFGIAYPVQMAEAKESVKTALVSSQMAMADLARQVVLTAKDAAPPSVAPDQMDAAADSNADTLAVPPSDLSRVLPNQGLTTPTMVVSNAAPVQPALSNSIPRPALACGRVARRRIGSVDQITCADVQSNVNTSEAPAARSCLANRNVFGVVISPDAVRVPSFGCDSDIGDQAPLRLGGHGPSLILGSCSWAITPNGYRVYPKFRPCFDVTLNVQLAEPSDAAKMRPGELVRLEGDFNLETKGQITYLYMTNAKVVWTDPFDRQATSALPAATPDDQSISLASAAAPEPGSDAHQNRTGYEMLAGSCRI